MGFKSLARGLRVPVVFTLLLLGAFTGTARSGEPYQIVGFGDSLMAGYELAPGESFPEQLEARLLAEGLDVTVANAGVSGDTTSGGLARLDWSVPEGTALVILELGANDALRGVAPEIVRNNLEAMISRLQERHIAVLLAGMLSPPNMGEDYARAFNAIFPELSAELGVPLVPFFLEGVAAEPKLLLSDGMHPNGDGVARMVENMLPHVRKMVEASRKGG